MIVISTHLDDACWSAHGLLRGATVVTICAGIPPAATAPTSFDVRAGFKTAQDAMRARRAEDHRAAARVGFTPRHLDCLDHGYGGGDIVATVQEALADARPGETVVGPVGLRHPDHEQVAEVFCAIVRAAGLNGWVYEDLPYAYAWPDTLAPALAARKIGEATITRPCDASKRLAVYDYASQAEGCRIGAILAPERYHRLTENSRL